MLSIVTLDEKEKWNRIVKSYQNWDVYYLCEYAESFCLHGDGKPLLIEFSYNDERFCYVVMQRDIAEDSRFQGYLSQGENYDIETPYGYGGPLCDRVISETTQTIFFNEINAFALENGIVSAFIRFHPLLMNHSVLSSIIKPQYLHQTVFIDTASPELIMTNMSSKNRNMVRKATKNGVTIVREEISNYKDFLPMYEETMLKDQAADYYFFKESYFEEQKKLKNNASLFYAMKDELPIAGAIMYHNDKFMHYHLAGTHTDYRKYAPSNLLLYEAACWASERGVKQFHLGGGIREDDNLFRFKKQFNKNGYLSFYIGRMIYDKDKYSYLVSLRKQINPSFDTENNRLIQYRK